MRRLQLTGSNGVPASGVSAVVMNVAVTDTTAGSYLTVYPDGVQRPTASSLNWAPGETRPNLVEVEVGSDGAVDFYNAAGTTDVVADLEGWVATPSTYQGPNGQFLPFTPSRVLDTRNGVGGYTQRVGQQPITVQVAQPGEEAVVLNVAVTNPTMASYLTIWPHGAQRPLAANLNFTAGQTVGNRVMVPVSSDGKIDIYNASGLVDVVADLNGAFTDGSSTFRGSLFMATTPTRMLDTRTGGGPIAGGSQITMALAGVGPIPADATAVVANVTVTNTTAPSYLTAYPDGASRPTASDLNWTTWETRGNLVVVKLGPDGKANFYNASGSTDLVIDIVGWYR